jgi:hypothetical protein
MLCREIKTSNGSLGFEVILSNAKNPEQNAPKR